MNIKGIKSQANYALKLDNRINTFSLIVLIGQLISIGLSSVPNLFSVFTEELVIEYPALTLVTSIPTFIISLFFSPLYSYALASAALKIIRHKNVSLNELISGFQVYGTILVYHLVTSIYVVLGAFAFIIPGVMLAYSYSMGYYIIAEDPSISATEARKKSAEMMKGYRFELFKLDFSFFGWYILSIFTLGLLTLWVVPKHDTARAVFYQKLKAIKYGEDNLDIIDENSFQI